MDMRQPLLASLLALTVTLAGTVCACGVAPIEPAEATQAHDAHHAHHAHQADTGASNADCAHADCQGDCGIDVVVPERDATVELPKPQFDGVLAVSPTAASIPLRPPSYHAPPMYAWRAADTPVRRFDVLLN